MTKELNVEQEAIESAAQSLGDGYGLRVPRIKVVNFRDDGFLGQLAGKCTHVGDTYEIQLSSRPEDFRQNVYAHESAHAVLFHNNPTFKLDRSTEHTDSLVDGALEGDTDAVVPHIMRLTVEDFYGESVAVFVGHTRGREFPLENMNGLSRLLNNKIAEWSNMVSEFADSLENKPKKEKAAVFAARGGKVLQESYQLAYDAGVLLGIYLARNRASIASEPNLFLLDASAYINMCIDVCELAQGDDDVFKDEFFRRLNQLSTSSNPPD